MQNQEKALTQGPKRLLLFFAKGFILTSSSAFYQH